MPGLAGHHSLQILSANTQRFVYPTDVVSVPHTDGAVAALQPIRDQQPGVVVGHASYASKLQLPAQVTDMGSNLRVSHAAAMFRLLAESRCRMSQSAPLPRLSRSFILVCGICVGYFAVFVSGMYVWAPLGPSVALPHMRHPAGEQGHPVTHCRCRLPNLQTAPRAV